jgi:hypothetical protein
MTTAEITQQALVRRLIRTTGNTPLATMSAQLYVLVRDDPEAPIIRLFDQGVERARRGSVRWALRRQ